MHARWATRHVPRSTRPRIKGLLGMRWAYWLEAGPQRKVDQPEAVELQERLVRRVCAVAWQGVHEEEEAHVAAEIEKRRGMCITKQVEAASHRDLSDVPT
jgi:hypothetical protein